MKKEYTKPVALIENFEMNEFIAGSCSDGGKLVYKDLSVLNSTLQLCAIEKNGNILFVSYCATIDGQDVSDYSTCYDGYLGGYFAS